MKGVQANFIVQNNIISEEILKKVSLVAMTEAMEKAGIEFIRWCNVGSPNESAVPPIRWAILRGSCSVFVGDKLVSIFQPPEGIDGEPTPAMTNDNPKQLEMKIVYNTDYATKVHEDLDLKYSQRSLVAGAQKKWLEKHCAADADDFWKLVAEFTGTKL